MHTFGLSHELFDVRINGAPTGLSKAFSEWTVHDRLGIIVNSPMGALGAALLIQAATSLYYQVRQEDNVAPTYPELYAFHVGGRFGDLSYYDFLPFRKEIFLQSGNPLAVLEAVNDRAITSLVVPLAAASNYKFAWQELNPALDRLRSAFFYDPTGVIKDGDLAVTADAELDHHTEHVVHPERSLELWDPIKTLGTPRAPAGDGRSRIEWLDRVRARLEETSPFDREAAEANYNALRSNGRVTQVFKTASPADAIDAIANASLDGWTKPGFPARGA